MSTRDNAMPYVEHTGARPDGVPTYAMHNLTAHDLSMVGELLRQRATGNRIIINEADQTPTLRSKLALETQRVDQLARCLDYIAQA